MKILYIANHNSGHNDDEGAVTYCLRKQGHEVSTPSEKGFHEYSSPSLQKRYDLVLIHKLPLSQDRVFATLKIPKVFWWFDLIHRTGDSDLNKRTEWRRQWMTTIGKQCDLGFMTDGTYAASHGYYHLPQGADGRYIGQGDAGEPRIPLCFVGTPTVGTERTRFIKRLRKDYGDKFYEPKTMVHQRKLADLVATTDIMIAPPSPTTDLYWSNRVYVMGGFGAFLMHPRCAGLEEQYVDGEEIIYYDDYDDLKGKIEHYKALPELRQRIAEAFYKRTVLGNTYFARVRQMMSTVEARLFKDPTLQAR